MSHFSFPLTFSGPFQSEAQRIVSVAQTAGVTVWTTTREANGESATLVHFERTTDRDYVSRLANDIPEPDAEDLAEEEAYYSDEDNDYEDDAEWI